MNLVNCSKNKMLSIVLVVSVLMATAISTVKFFGNRELLRVCNSVSVEKLDENHAVLSCFSPRAKVNEMLFSKSKDLDEYRYDISDTGNLKNFYSFKSKDNIVIDDSLSANPTLCGAIAAAVTAPTVASVAVAVGTTGSAAIAAAPVAGAIAGAGATSAAAGLGWASGAGIAAAVAVSAAPVVVVGGAIFGLLSVG